MKHAVDEVTEVKRVSKFTVSAENVRRFSGEELNSIRPSHAADIMITEATISRLQNLLM